MILNMNWKNFRSIHGEEGSRSKFENLMYDLLCREYPSEKVHKTDSSRGGDGGIDIFVEKDGGIDIYQCKFFLDTMERTQWKQVVASFESSMKSAEKDSVKVLKWFLCTPFVSNRDPVGPWKRWNKFVDENVRAIEDSMEWLDGARIIQKLEQPALGDIRVKYFTSNESVFRKEGANKADSYRREGDKLKDIRVTGSVYPKVFISYSWTSEEYKRRVLDLAIRLRNDGVDVILDQWELRPGHNIYAFMEQSLKDSDKVLILCDKEYASKADNRSRGVGAETQIITPDVYGKYRQEKFIPVIVEKSAVVPSYLRSVDAVYYTKDEEYKDLFLAILGKPREEKRPLPEATFEWLIDKSITSQGFPCDEIANANFFSSKPDVLHKGDKYKFGHYPKEQEGKDEPLIWRVLDVDTEKGLALLITENLIDCCKYHGKVVDIVWEDCDLHKWLNGYFIDNAFSKEEQKKIAERLIQNLDNTRYGTKGGREFKGRIFALSIEEAEKYFKDDMDRRAAVTPYAKKHGGYSDKEYTTSDGCPAGWWWLRSPGDSSNTASIVFAGGGIRVAGVSVIHILVSVRPALWINL